MGEVNGRRGQSHKRHEFRGVPLTLLGDDTVESDGSSVGKFKGNKQPMFRGESTGFVNRVTKLAIPLYTLRYVVKSRSRQARQPLEVP